MKKHTHIFPVYMTVAKVKVEAKNDKDADKRAKKWIEKRACMWNIGGQPIMELTIGKVKRL